MRKFRLASVLVPAALALLAGCAERPSRIEQGRSDRDAASVRGAGTDEHEHRPGVHGGFVVAVGDAHYHVELVVEEDGTLRLFLLGEDESRVVEVARQTLNSYVRVSGESRAIPVPLRPAPQDGDAPGRTSQFAGALPDDLAGQSLEITVPALRIGGERFRVRWSVPARAEHPEMPAKVVDEEERALYLVAGGRYTEADIAANAGLTASQKYASFRARHDFNPQPGDRICPITRTKAHPECTWVVDGQTYAFCCPPCIDEFVLLAKEQPDELREADEHVQR